MRRLSADEAALWKRVVAEVRPLHVGAPEQPIRHPRESGNPAPPGPAKPHSGIEPKRQELDPHFRGDDGKGKGRVAKEGGANTLDASWDRRLVRGLVAPDSTVDLHGHSLASAYDRLDQGLAQALARHDRVLLLVTGKPPGPQSQRPHARGAIRAAVADWLAASRHADRIAAVRPAHQRHGGQGALYIVLRRSRTAAPRNS